MIPPSRSRLSYKDRLSYKKQRFRSLAVLGFFFLMYILFSTLFVTPWVIETQGMIPSFMPGTRILVSPYLLRDKDGHLKASPRRGDFVSIQSPYIARETWFLKILNPLVRFLTIQKLSFPLESGNILNNRRLFKRIIGIPGDTVKMINSIAYVKRAGEDYFISEFEQNSVDYNVKSQILPENWSSAMPISLSTEEVVLEDNEYFILSDNREFTNDSRYWGPVSDLEIRGRVILVYWPIENFGRIR